MASRGWKVDQVGKGTPTDVLIAADLKFAQRAGGLIVGPGSYNNSQYGSTGEWRVDERGPVTVKLPAFAFSIASKRGIVITVKNPDIRIFSTAGVLHSHALSYRADTYWKVATELVHRGDRVSAFSAEWEALKDNIERIANQYNYDRSDLQSDYFDVGFYLTVKLDEKLTAGNQAKAERTISALENAFPDTWERMLAEAANEQALETTYAEHYPEEKVQSTRRDLLEASARRALEAVDAGTVKVPFNASRRGWGRSRQFHTVKGQVSYLRREKKLKVGLLVGYVSEEAGIAALIDNNGNEGPAVGPDEHEWRVNKLTGGRGGSYRNKEMLAGGVAASLEAAVDAADAAMGYAPGGN